MRLVVPFDAVETPELVQVGGKAMSLISMARNGLPVPPGLVLTAAFFQPWLEHIQSTPEWNQVLDSTPTDLSSKCSIVKALCAGLELDDARKQALARGLQALGGGGETPLFAVRSSSPEEDLEGLSFAGGYETTLGVTRDKLEEAVRHSFASCFDERVLLYKREHELPRDKPRIAVIVQQQIAAEAAGVAFSLNPMNNCYDEAVINANFGLGESVVAGMASPDCFVVDKATRTILERKIGNKETSVWLGTDGGTYKHASPAQAQLCLSDEEVLALTDMVAEVEHYYGRPMDIEWALAPAIPSPRKLYLLQARPITAYVPLPEKMQTKPCQARRLYIDYTIAKQGINTPFSVMGADCWDRIQRQMLTGSMGAASTPDIHDDLTFSLGGRFYSDLGNYLKLQGKQRTADQIRLYDALSAEIIEHLDDSYTPTKLSRPFVGAVIRMALRRGRTIVPALRAFSQPERYHVAFQERTQAFVRNLKQEAARGLTPGELVSRLNQHFAGYMNRVSLPVTIAAELARSKMKKLLAEADPALRDTVIYLERALPDNITIEMGLAMYRLAGSEELTECSSAEDFARRIQQRSLSPVFMRAWDDFMAKYGHRGPNELDIASPRLYERPEEFYRQLQTMAPGRDSVHEADAHNPQAVFERGIADRQEAYETLLRIVRGKGKRQGRRFAKYYSVLVRFGAYREIHKYYVILLLALIRKAALSAALCLVDEGRLDSPEQVFDLTVEDLERSLTDPALDLRVLAEENTRFLRTLGHVRNFPRIIDSRGRILRASTREAKEGEMLGEPISPGTVRGRVKTLSRPGQKPVLPGEILVARATDPGWIPHFLNAGGIILEVGGMLQHGAVVARESCKPCVAGIEDATSILEDGQVVEVDGTTGIVRLIEEDSR